MSLEAPIPRDRREHPRIDVVATAALSAGTRYIGSYSLESLSSGGAQLLGDPGVSVGESVRLLVQVPGRAISLSGEIVRCDVRESEHRFAVAFRHLSSAVTDTLQELFSALKDLPAST